MIPLLAGPGAMAALLGLDSREENLTLALPGTIAGILVIGATIFVAFRLGDRLSRLIGPGAIAARDGRHGSDRALDRRRDGRPRHPRARRRARCGIEPPVAALRGADAGQEPSVDFSTCEVHNSTLPGWENVAKALDVAPHCGRHAGRWGEAREPARAATQTAMLPAG
jgi:hypothetical protein